MKTSMEGAQRASAVLPPGGFLTVQALRAIAALLVVLYHALSIWGDASTVSPSALVGKTARLASISSLWSADL